MSVTLRSLILGTGLTTASLGAALVVLAYNPSPVLAPQPPVMPAARPAGLPQPPPQPAATRSPHETSLAAGKVLHAGSRGSVRVDVHAVESALETRPHAGALVRVSLKTTPAGEQTPRTVDLVEGKTGADGEADLSFNVPPVAPGSHTLVVYTKSDERDETLEREVTIRRVAKVLLTTDKPLYQPGQTIHLRTLALDPFDLAPLAGSDLTFEVADGKGNTVFRKVLKTSDHGIAATDFTLADEVNRGEYHVRAALGDHRAERTVTVRPYVMPRFKIALKADKAFYLPSETLKLDLQADYLFGKPLTGAKLRATASTFDVAFKDFQTLEAATDASGHASFEVKLPAYFVGQPLASGHGLVKLEVTVTDTADHAESVTKTYPVVEQPVRVNVVPEGGRIVPEVENRLFIAASYPDGQPAADTAVKVWLGARSEGQPLATVTTDATGLAELAVTPRAARLRAGPAAAQEIEMLGRQNVVQEWMPRNQLDVTVAARDVRGQSARATVALACEPLGSNLLLRLDKAVYQAGDTLRVDVRTSGGLPTAYLDVVRDGQVLLTKWVDVKDGRASYALDLPPTVFGSVEVHAYQVVPTGEVVRDARVVYVQPSRGLKVEARADADVHRPGTPGKISFLVTDTDGKPAPAALGVIVVDEAVYALQEIQPGLEKVFFTLQEELQKPQVQVLAPGATLDEVVRAAEVPVDRQRVAQVLLTAARPKAPEVWTVDPRIERRQAAEMQLLALGQLFYEQARPLKALVTDERTGRVTFRPGFFEEALKANGWNLDQLNDSTGQRWTPERMALVHPGFTAARMAEASTRQSGSMLAAWIGAWTAQRSTDYFKNGRWSLPDDVLRRLAEQRGGPEANQEGTAICDVWDRRVRMVRRHEPRHASGAPSVWDDYKLVSLGPDGTLGTADDIESLPPDRPNDLSEVWFLDRSAWQGRQDLAWRDNGPAQGINNMYARMMRRGGGARFRAG